MPQRDFSTQNPSFLPLARRGARGGSALAPIVVSGSTQPATVLRPVHRSRGLSNPRGWGGRSAYTISITLSSRELDPISTVTDREPSPARSSHERETMIEALPHSNGLRAGDGSRSGGSVRLRPLTLGGEKAAHGSLTRKKPWCCVLLRGALNWQGDPVPVKLV